MIISSGPLMESKRVIDAPIKVPRISTFPLAEAPRLATVPLEFGPQSDESFVRIR